MGGVGCHALLHPCPPPCILPEVDLEKFNYALLESTPFQMQMIIYQSSECINDKRNQFRRDLLLL